MGRAAKRYGVVVDANMVVPSSVVGWSPVFLEDVVTLPVASKNKASENRKQQQVGGVGRRDSATR